jgi:hypothetical protein
MHGDGMRSPNCDIQINPEFSHVSGPDPKLPSPGLKTSFFGVALVVTEMMPAGVTMDAVTATGIHNNGLTQIHVPISTNPRLAGGAKFPHIAGRLSYTIDAACCASCSVETWGIQW